MPKFVVHGSMKMTAVHSCQCDSIQEAVKHFQVFHKSYTPTHVSRVMQDGEILDEETIVGFCESCKNCLVEGEERVTTEDDVTLCQACVVRMYSDEDHHL